MSLTLFRILQKGHNMSKLTIYLVLQPRTSPTDHFIHFDCNISLNASQKSSCPGPTTLPTAIPQRTLRVAYKTNINSKKWATKHNLPYSTLHRRAKLQQLNYNVNKQTKQPLVTEEEEQTVQKSVINFEKTIYYIPAPVSKICPGITSYRCHSNVHQSFFFGTANHAIVSFVCF